MHPFTDTADLLEFINDAEYIVYVLNSKYILISYLYNSVIITSPVSMEIEAILQALRSRKIGSLRIIKASILEQQLVKELPADQRRRWLSRPRDARAALKAYRDAHSPPGS